MNGWLNLIVSKTGSKLILHLETCEMETERSVLLRLRLGHHPHAKACSWDNNPFACWFTLWAVGLMHSYIAYMYF